MDIAIFCDIAKNKHKNSRAVTAWIAIKLIQYTSQKMWNYRLTCLCDYKIINLTEIYNAPGNIRWSSF